MSKNLNRSNILLCGSSRVGKSTLINSICQENLVKSNNSLNLHTKTVDQYSFKSSIGDLIHETIFWDTPGIESWNKDSLDNYIISLIEKTNPICLIYCASPGSFVSLDNLASIVFECHQRNIFCALVCTNKWSGPQRQIVINEFCQVLNMIYPEIEPNKEDEIIYYDRFGLVTMVNSVEYVDEDFGIFKGPSGVEELIFGISKCLQRDSMFLWLTTVSHNKSFWTKMSSKLGDLIQIPFDKLDNLLQHAENFLEYLLDIPEDYSSLPTNNSVIHDQTEDHLFQDAEIIEMPQNCVKKKLKFLLKSTETTVQLSETLVTLGATNVNVVQSQTTDQIENIITVEFNDVECMKAMYDLCQIITHSEVNFTIVDQSSDNLKINSC